MSSTTLAKDYKERIVPELTEEFKYTTPMQVPRLEKIVINQGLGAATQDKKLIETAINELTAITGQKAVATLSRKDISNFKVRKKMPMKIQLLMRMSRIVISTPFIESGNMPLADNWPTKISGNNESRWSIV